MADTQIHAADVGGSLRRAARIPGRWHLRPITTFVLVVVLGAVVTGLASYTAAHLDHTNERRLLQVQSRQAAALVGSAITGVEAPLQTAVEIAAVTGGDRSAFVRYISSHAGPSGTFSAASLWKLTSTSATPIAMVGTFHPSTTRATRLQLILRAKHENQLAVAGVPVTALTRISYALVDPTGSYAVYAERAIPADRQVPVEHDSAFSEIHFATYLGQTTATPEIATTDMSDKQLPLTGRILRTTIPFGDTSITLVTKARGHLGGTFSANLWWITLAAGAALTLAAAMGGARLTRRRLNAESDARTIGDLYQRLDNQYGQQRSIALTLQQALLPQVNPSIPGLEIGSIYVAGASGVDVGGDWYSIIQVDEDTFAFVVGDVSGRGVRAASIMARMRFTIRAYLAEGHAPDEVLRLANRQLNLHEDGHFATVLVGRGSLSTREITVASAGHLPPANRSADAVELVTGPISPPLGIADPAYGSKTFTMAPGSMLLAYTDGLVERRDEAIDAGLERLRVAVAGVDGPIDDVINSVVARMTDNKAEDDLAVLAFRWR